MTTLMHRNINPILDKVAWLQGIIFVFEEMKLTFSRIQETRQIRQPFYSRELDDCEMRSIR